MACSGNKVGLEFVLNQYNRTTTANYFSGAFLRPPPGSERGRLLRPGPEQQRSHRLRAGRVFGHRRRVHVPAEGMRLQ